MKATINEQGYLCISAETPLESYALRRWSETNMPISTRQLPEIIVSWGTADFKKSNESDAL